MRELSAAKQVSSRRGVSVVLTVLLTVGVLLLATIASDFGSIVLVRSQLQSAADAAALTGAADLTLPRDETIRYEVLPGMWHSDRRRFLEPAANPNAVRITARLTKTLLTKTLLTKTLLTKTLLTKTLLTKTLLTKTPSAKTGEDASPLFFSWLFDRLPFTSQASAVATTAVRDIALVVDLSGSMNDDTEPCWSSARSSDAFDLARRDDGWRCHAVGLGMGADHDYVDLLAGLGDAQSENSGLRDPQRPGDDENRLVTLLKHLLANPRVRLVQ